MDGKTKDDAMNDDEYSERTQKARAQWFYRGQERPDFAESPAPGQQSVWDFPRPPALMECQFRCEVKVGELVIASSDRCWMVCETAHPPTYYFPREDVASNFIRATTGSSFCEWKGDAAYYSVVAGDVNAMRSAWGYQNPFKEFEALRGAMAFMPAPFECFVNGERVRPQPGGFYGGWITSHFCGPFKGEDGISG